MKHEGYFAYKARDVVEIPPNLKILVVGLDNTGKSTLVEHLQKLLDFPVMKSPGPSTPQYFEEWLEKEIKREGSMIYDRFPLIDEPAYGPVMRGINSLPPHYTMRDYAVDQMAHGQSVVLIYCRPPTYKITGSSYAERNQYPTDVDDVLQISKLLDIAFMRMVSDPAILHNLELVLFDWTLDSDFIGVDAVLFEVIGRGKEKEREHK